MMYDKWGTLKANFPTQAIYINVAPLQVKIQFGQAKITPHCHLTTTLVLCLTANHGARLGNIVALLSWGHSFKKVLTLCSGSVTVRWYMAIRLGMVWLYSH